MKGKMLGVSILLCVAVFQVSVLLGSMEDKVLLRYKWTLGGELMSKYHVKGQCLYNNCHTWKYDKSKPKSEAKIIMREYEPDSFSLDKEQLTRERVLSLDKKGNATISFDVKTVALRKGKVGAMTKVGAGDWQGPFKQTVSTLGEVKEVKPGALKKYYKEKVEASRLTEPIMLRLPEGRVGIGDTWKTPGKITDLMTSHPDISYELTYRLKRFDTIGGKRCAVISAKATIEQDLLEGKWETRKNGKKKKSVLKDLKANIHKEYIFDIEAGMVIRSKVAREETYKDLYNYRKEKYDWWWESDAELSVTITSELLKAKTAK
jgi:hypothetical protein